MDTLRACDHLQARIEDQGDPEDGQRPYFHSDTPPGEIFQKQAIPLLETLRACR